MEHFDALMLARLQFAFTVSFHIIFPAFTIGLASYLAVLEGLWLLTGREVFLAVFNYWKKIFAVSFGMGVVSGIVMSYQFGTNWSVFADKAGPVIGPLMGYEVLTAFFLEAGFLGIMLFGMERVGKVLHFVATALVAFGTVLSTFWILSANSWMQTPAGHAINAAGQFVPVDWWAIIFNPSFPYRLVHMVLAAYLTTAFVVGGVGAFHLLRDRRNEGARLMFSMAMWMAAVVAPLQIFAGDLHGLNTLEAPAGQGRRHGGPLRNPRRPAADPVRLPDMEAETTRYAIEVPKLGSLILTHNRNGVVKGLKAWPKSGPPLRAADLLELPGHGGHRRADGRRGHVEPAAAPARPPDRQYVAIAHERLDVAGGLYRRPRRLDHDRGGAPALYRLWPFAHVRLGGGDRSTGRCRLAHRLHRGLLRRVRRGHLLHPAPDGPYPAARRARYRSRCTRAGRGHHAGARRWRARTTQS